MTPAATLSKAVRHYVVDHDDYSSLADLARSLGWSPSTFYTVINGAQASKPLMAALLDLDPNLSACAECGWATCECPNAHNSYGDE